VITLSGFYCRFIVFFIFFTFFEFVDSREVDNYLAQLRCQDPHPFKETKEGHPAVSKRERDRGKE